jgi:hypothetical protein
VTPIFPPSYFAAYCFGPSARISPAITYNTSTQVWTVAAGASSFVSIQTSDPDQSAILINGFYAMFIWKATGKIGVGDILTKVNPGDYPRLDFFRQSGPVPRRIASLSQNGRLSVINWTEKVTPTGTDRMYLLTPYSSISAEGLAAPGGVVQMELLYDSKTGNYLADGSGLLLSRK